MTAAPLLRTTIVSTPHNAAPAHSRPGRESTFKGQFDDAVQGQQKDPTKEAKQGSSSDDDARDPALKNEDRPQLPIIAALIATPLPTPQPAGFGSPSSGTEPGPASSGASIQTPVIAGTGSVATEIPEPVTLVSPPVDPPDPPPEAAEVDLKTAPAFALRLADLTPHQESPLKMDWLGLQRRPLDLAPAQPLAAAPEMPDFALMPRQPEAPKQPLPAAGVPTAQATTQAHETAAPAISAAPPSSVVLAQDSHPAQTGSGGSDRGASEKAPPAESPGPERQRVTDRTPPQIEVKPAHESAASPAPENNGHKDTPLQAPGPPQTAMTPPATAPRTPEPVSTAAAPASERVSATPAAVRNNPALEVTDVSLTVPVPRADSAGEDRVAIRMVQRGAEIHVSVRTPDNQLSQALRQDLGRLAAGLDEAGFRTETWRPAVTSVAAPSPSSAHHESSPGASHRDTPGSDAQSGGSQGRNPGEQRRRQPDERPRWVAELEQHKNRIAGEQQ